MNGVECQFFEQSIETLFGMSFCLYDVINSVVTSGVSYRMLSTCAMIMANDATSLFRVQRTDNDFVICSACESLNNLTVHIFIMFFKTLLPRLMIKVFVSRLEVTTT